MLVAYERSPDRTLDVVQRPERLDRVRVVARKLERRGMLDERIDTVVGRPDELARVHTRRHIEVVERECLWLEAYGGALLSTDDTTIDPGSYDAAARAAGGTLRAQTRMDPTPYLEALMKTTRAYFEGWIEAIEEPEPKPLPLSARCTQAHVEGTEADVAFTMGWAIAVDVRVRAIVPSDSSNYRSILQRTTPEDRYCRFLHFVDHFDDAAIARYVKPRSDVIGFIAEQPGQPLGSSRSGVSPV